MRPSPGVEPVRVLVVDDCVTYRHLVPRVLATLADVEVVGTAPNGKIALQKIEQLQPDLLLLDLEMPEVDGLEVLRRLRAAESEVGAIMLSGLTDAGASSTLEALTLGVFDFVLRPRGGSLDENLQQLRGELRPKIEAFSRTHSIRRILHSRPPARKVEELPSSAVAASRSTQPPAHARLLRAEAVALGISTGGPQSLNAMLPALPAALAAPLLIVQHMPPFFTRSLAEDLDRRCSLAVCEASDGQTISPGTVYIAPGGRHMTVARDAGKVVVRITDDPPENSCGPSVDYLFRSVAEVYGARAAGVIMTGMSNDGAEGCRLLKRAGGAVLAQDQATCVVFGMPREPIEQGIADVVAPLERIAAEIVRLAGRRCSMKVRPEDIQPVARMVAQLCGVVLDDSKGCLIESRLSALAEAAGCRDFAEFARRVRTDAEPHLRNRVIQAITTQETLFFRDSSPFEVLAHWVLPDLIDSKAGSLFPKRLRIWSAACSTGQEPYSIAMTLRETIPDVHSWDINILATDIAETAIEQVFRNGCDDGGQIVVTVNRLDEAFRVAVADRGVGIPEDELEAVFDEFVQSSKTRTGAGGTGLGLAISRQIVQQHGGRIWAKNRPGGGALVCFDIPTGQPRTGGKTQQEHLLQHCVSSGAAGE